MDKRLLWLAVGAFTMGTVGFVFASLLPAIAAETHTSVPQAAYLITAYAMAYAIGGPVLSTIAGDRDRRTLLTATMLAFVAGCGIVAISPSFAVVLSAQAVLGASAGFFAATAQATAVSMMGPEHRARAISAVVGGTTFAVALGAPLGALVATFFGWRGTFVAVALLGLFCAGALWVGLPRHLRGARLSLSERVRAIGQPGILPSLAVSMLYLSGGFIVISYLGPLAIQGAGLAPEALPLVLLAFGIGAVIGNMVSGYLSDRIGATRVIVLSLLASCTVSLLIALALNVLPHGLAGPFLIGIMVPWGIIGWSFPPAQASRIVGFAPEAAHLTLSLNASAFYFGIAIGTTVGGRVLEVSVPAELGVAATVFPALALLLLLAGRMRQGARALAPGE
jgi:predicted MFS family arabinose efflux permease